MNLQTPGVFALTDLMTAGQLTGFVRNVEKHRYGSLWFPEGIDRDPFAVAAHYHAGATHVSMTLVRAERSPTERASRRNPVSGAGTRLIPDQYRSELTRLMKRRRI